MEKYFEVSAVVDVGCGGYKGIYLMKNLILRFSCLEIPNN